MECNKKGRVEHMTGMDLSDAESGLRENRRSLDYKLERTLPDNEGGLRGDSVVRTILRFLRLEALPDYL